MGAGPMVLPRGVGGEKPPTQNKQEEKKQPVRFLRREIFIRTEQAARQRVFICKTGVFQISILTVAVEDATDWMFG